MKLGFPTRNYNCSDKYKIIFIHVPRTGGGTINQLLEIPKRYQGHRTPFELRLCIDPVKWNEYKKIVVCRNPWDRMVSLYHYRISKGYDKNTGFSTENFNDWLVNPGVRKCRAAVEWTPLFDVLNYPNLTEIKNNPTITDSEYKVSVIPFETLSTSWVEWCLKNDMTELAEKSREHFKTTFINKTEREDYKKYYTDIGKIFVYGIFQIDAFMWGYDFELTGPPTFTTIRSNIAKKENVPIEMINSQWVDLVMYGDGAARNFAKGDIKL